MHPADHPGGNREVGRVFRLGCDARRCVDSDRFLHTFTLALAEYRAAMPEIVEALSLTALVAATLEYAILMRRREERRDEARWQAEVRESLLSVRGVGTAPHRQWTDDGTRFRVVP